MAKETVIPELKSPEGFDDPPFGMTVLWGEKGVGKTVTALNSPWKPVYHIDTEFSALDYERQMPLMISEGLLNAEFIRMPVNTYDDAYDEIVRLKNSDEMYGTIIVDTAGQLTEWWKAHEFASVSDVKALKMSQVVWGDIRGKLRNALMELQAHCKLLILTAHQREWQGSFSPRANPAVLELASLSIRLVKKPNQKIPDGMIYSKRLPVFPPRVESFSIAKLLDYMEKPADWDKLKDSELIETPHAIATPTPPVED